MVKKSSIKMVVFLVIASLLVLTIGCSKPAAAPTPTPAAEQKPVSLKFITSWSKGSVNYEKAEAYANTVNELSNGKLDIKIVGGTEAFPSTETVEAVRKGAMDGAYTSSDYYTGYIPEASALSVSMMTHAEAEKSGGLKLIQDIYKKQNLMLVNLDDMASYLGFHIWTKEPINSLADIKGKRFRTSAGPLGDTMKALGANVVNMPLGEVFSALEQGLIDGYTVPSFIGAKEGFFQYAKYCYTPTMFGGGAGVVINLDSWNKIPKDLQDLILSSETNAKVNDAYKAVNKVVVDENFKTFAEMGGKVVPLSDADSKLLMDTLSKLSWEYVKSKAPENAEALEKALKK